jgi:hypothetical protein
VDADSKARVYTGLARITVERALVLHTQAGRVIHDLALDVYRLRELARDPLPLDALRYSSAAEQEAAAIVALLLSHQLGSHAPILAVLAPGWLSARFRRPFWVPFVVIMALIWIVLTAR